MTLHDNFSARAAASPDAVAVVDAGRMLSYRMLDAISTQVAFGLRSRGVEPRSLVGVSLARSADAITAIVGVLKAGCAYVPLDPTYPDLRLRSVVADAGLEVVIGDRQPPIASSTFTIEELVDSRPAASALPRVTNRDLAYVIYTSGSTGSPKGVCVRHGNVLSLFAAARSKFDFRAADVWTLFHSCSFDFSVWEIWGALLHGGTLIVVPLETARASPAFLDLLASERVTVLNQVPSAFKYLAAEYPAAVADLKLRYVIFGGEPVDLAAVREWLSVDAAPGPEFVNMYGITETTVHVTHKVLDSRDLGDPGSPIGRALPHLEVTLRNESGEPVRPGEIGEIYVGGAGVAAGYLNQPQLTAERFIPFGPMRQIQYRSGDLARARPDGELEFHGRADRQIKLRGFRIELDEVERTIELYRGVASAAALVTRSRRDEPLIVGFYTCFPGTPVSASDLRQHVKERLPPYMVPARITALPSLPRTPSGKVDYRELEALQRTL